MAPLHSSALFVLLLCSSMSPLRGLQLPSGRTHLISCGVLQRLPGVPAPAPGTLPLPPPQPLSPKCSLTVSPLNSQQRFPLSEMHLHRGTTRRWWAQLCAVVVHLRSRLEPAGAAQPQLHPAPAAPSTRLSSLPGPLHTCTPPAQQEAKAKRLSSQTLPRCSSASSSALPLARQHSLPRPAAPCCHTRAFSTDSLHPAVGYMQCPPHTQLSHCHYAALRGEM